jgi:transposase-like protein
MAARVFSVEFRSAIAQRILNGESVLDLATEFKIKRSILYRWRDAYRLAGKDGFRKTRGRPRGSTTQVKTKPGMTGADRRIAELERRIGRLSMENDFLARAFKRVKEARSKNSASGEARCTEK